MKYEIRLPRCGVDMEEGTIESWKKSPGQFVAKDELLFTLETDKVVQEITADKEGYLREIKVPEGETVPVGTPIAIMTTTADEAY